MTKPVVHIAEENEREVVPQWNAFNDNRSLRLRNEYVLLESCLLPDPDEHNPNREEFCDIDTMKSKMRSCSKIVASENFGTALSAVERFEHNNVFKCPSDEEPALHYNVRMSRENHNKTLPCPTSKRVDENFMYAFQGSRGSMLGTDGCRVLWVEEKSRNRLLQTTLME